MQLVSTTKLIGFCLGCLSIVLSFASLCEEVIWEKNQNIFIKLIDVDTKEFAHPSSPDAAELNAFLTNVSVINNDKQNAQALFTEEQVHLLSEHLPKAFEQAKQNQVIVFSLSQTKSSFAGIIKREAFTAGAFFMQQDALTLSVGDVNKERDRGFEAVYDPTNLGLVRYAFNYGLEGSSSLNKSSQLGFSLELDGILQEQANQVGLALTNLSEHIFKEQNQSIVQQVSNTPSTGLTRQEVEQIITQREAVAKSKKVVEQEPSSNAVGESSVNTNEALPRSLAERFKTLEKLFQQGLISNDEYQAKRKELLDEI